MTAQGGGGGGELPIHQRFLEPQMSETCSGTRDALVEFRGQDGDAQMCQSRKGHPNCDISRAPGDNQVQGLLSTAHKARSSSHSCQPGALPSAPFLQPFPEVGDTAGAPGQVSLLPSGQVRFPPTSCLSQRPTEPMFRSSGRAACELALATENESHAHVDTRILQFRQLPKEHIF